MRKMLNLGCGSRYHLDWINVDFNPASEEIISHDLSKPLPFVDDSFDIVYHSHVLEHFGRQEGAKFLGECYRVSRNGGVVRVAVPDLEVIVRLYLFYLEKALKGKLGADIRYDWMILELYDQMVRTSTGGETHRFLTRQKHLFEVTEFLKSRFGNFNQQYNKNNLCILKRIKNSIYKPKKLHDIFARYVVKSVMFLCWGKKGLKVASEALFRLQGEVHRWMYDRYSLSRALANAGFSEMTICSPNESRIAGWKDYELEVDNDGLACHPDSLICEAVK